jgi:hypothetical protein
MMATAVTRMNPSIARGLGLVRVVAFNFSDLSR